MKIYELLLFFFWGGALFWQKIRAPIIFFSLFV